jgi:hypothetical protein
MLANRPRRTASHGLGQIRHLDRRQRGFEALVSHLQSGAVDGLLQSLAGKHAESMGYARLLRGLPDAARNFIHNDVVVGGIAAQQATQADNRVIPPSPGESAGGHRNFECAGHTNDFDIFALCPAAQQSVACASKQPLGNELVKPGDDNAKMFSRSVEISLNRPYLNRGRGIERRILFMIVLRDPAPPWRNRSRTATTFTSP